jgi:hypothetical protein
MVAYGLLGGSSDMLTTVSHIVDRNDDDMYVLTEIVLFRNFNALTPKNFINFILRYEFPGQNIVRTNSFYTYSEKDFVLNPSEEQVAARVKKEMQAKNNLIIDNSKGNDYQTICKYSSLIFSKLRTHWLRLVTDVTNAFFLNSL